mgnify:CR=1 FL=1
MDDYLIGFQDFVYSLSSGPDDVLVLLLVDLHRHLQLDVSLASPQGHW